MAQWFDLDLVAVASVAPVTSSGPSFEVSSSGSSFEVSNIIAGWGAQMGSREAGVTRARGCVCGQKLNSSKLVAIHAPHQLVQVI